MKKLLLIIVMALVSCGEKEEPLKEGVARLTVAGMDCSHCEAHVEDALFSLEGITWVQADVNKGEVLFKGVATQSSILEALKVAGEGCNKVYELK